jgi:AcrR family transcriptional regulator
VSNEPQGAPDDTDERVQRSKTAVLSATYQLLSEAGLAGASVDAIARRSGVAKATIYRHWPTRSALLLDACSKLGGKSDIPDRGGLHADMKALAEMLAHQLRSARWATILPSIIDAAERDPETAKLHAGLHAGFTTGFLAAIERGRARGELPPGHEPADIVAAVMGPLFYRRWFSREPLDAIFVAGVVDRAVGKPSTKRAKR